MRNIPWGSLHSALMLIGVLSFAPLSMADDLGEWHYHLKRQEGPTIEVSLRFACDDRRSTDLHLQKEWGGIVNDGSDVAHLKVLDQQQRPCQVTQIEPTRWRVEHAPGATLEVRYEILETGTRAPIPGNDYRTRLSGELFQVIGHLGILTPRREGNDTDIHAKISLDGFHQRGWEIVSSFGHGEGTYEYRGSPEDFLHVVLFAGKLKVVQRTLEGNQVAIAIAGNVWQFSADELADAVEKIVQAERDFFSDHTDPWFLVTLTPTVRLTPTSTSLGGTALRHAFCLFCTPSLSLSQDSRSSEQTLRLLAHEYFHTWNGSKIPTAGKDPSTYWFSEGFTNFFARRILLRSQLFTPEQFAQDLNSVLARYEANPARHRGMDFVRTEFWKDRDAQELPYQQGDLVALMLDEHIAQRSNGTKSLDDFMIDLFLHPIADSPITTESLLTRIQTWVDADTTERVREMVLHGADLELPKKLRFPELILATDTIPSDHASPAREVRVYRLH